jgi:superfamily II DNA helicase RecQ
MAVTASAYRPKLAELYQLRKIPCQYVLLTGTLPPTLQARLCDVLLLGTYDDGLRYVRALTDKGNVAYHVQTCRDGQLERRALQLMKEVQRQLRTGFKAILFCRDTTKCMNMAQLLGCEPYLHANITTDAFVALRKA